MMKKKKKRKRKERKAKIRKNNHKKEESFTKVKMAGDLCQTHLLSIIKSMTDKEMLNRQLIYLDNVAFMSKVSTIQKNKIPKEYVNQNNEIVSFMNSIKPPEFDVMIIS